MNLISLSLSSLVRTAYSGSPPLAKQTNLTTESFIFHLNTIFRSAQLEDVPPHCSKLLWSNMYTPRRASSVNKFLCFQLMMWLVVFLLFQTQTCFSLRSFKAPDLALCLSASPGAVPLALHLSLTISQRRIIQYCTCCRRTNALC